MPDVSAVIFDLGQVLIQWDPTRAFAPELTAQAARAALDAMDFGEFNHRLDAGEPYEDVRRDLAGRHPAAVGHLDRYRTRIADAIVGPVPGTEEIVQHLAANGVALFGLTNWPAESFHLAEPKAPAIGLLTDVFVSGIEKVAKPDPAAFERAIARFGVTPGETLFVDDTEPNVAAARRCGLLAHQFVGADELREALAALGLLEAVAR